MMKMSGYFTMRVPFNVALDITDEELAQLTPEQHDQLITQHVNLAEAVQRAEVKELEVYDVNDKELQHT